MLGLRGLRFWTLDPHTSLAWYYNAWCVMMVKSGINLLMDRHAQNVIKKYKGDFKHFTNLNGTLNKYYNNIKQTVKQNPNWTFIGSLKTFQRKIKWNAKHLNLRLPGRGGKSWSYDGENLISLLFIIMIMSIIMFIIMFILFIIMMVRTWSPHCSSSATSATRYIHLHVLL